MQGGVSLVETAQFPMVDVGAYTNSDGILKQKDSHVVPNTGRNPYEM